MATSAHITETTYTDCINISETRSSGQNS